jgi:hypothetical protein
VVSHVLGGWAVVEVLQVTTPTDTELLDYLNRQAELGLVTFGLELDGGVFVEVQPLGSAGVSIRERNDVRELLTMAMQALP